MSRIIYNLSESFYVGNAIHIVVPSLQLKFSDFIRTQLNNKNLSYRKVAEKSGGLITHSTVGDIINEKVNSITVDVIIALSKGIGITEQELFDAARGKSPDALRIADERFEYISKAYAKISDEKKESLEPLISVLEVTLQTEIGMRTKSAQQKLEKYFIEYSDDEESEIEKIKKPLRRKAS